MRLTSPLYESLPLIYILGGVTMLAVSYHLHSGGGSLLLLIAGVAALIAGVAVWLRRRDFRAADAQYWSRRDADDDALR